MKKVFVLLMLALMALSCSKKEGAIKIGVILPLTGDYAIYGQKMKEGIDLASSLYDHRNQTTDVQIALNYEDDAGDPKKTVSAFEKLVSVENTPIVIGGAISSCALAVVPLADREKVILFSPAATSPKLTGISQYFFRNWPSDFYEGKVMASFATENLKITKIALLYVNNDWGVGITAVFKEEILTHNCKITDEESFEPGTTNFRTQLGKIKHSNPDAIYVIGYIKELLPLVRQKEELGIKATILSSYGFYDEQLLKNASQAVEGSIFTAPTYDTSASDSSTQSFVSKYKEKYGTAPDIWSAQAFDAFQIVAKTIIDGAKGSTEIRNALLKTKQYDGASGKTSFDEKGEVQKPMKIMTIKNRKFIEYHK